MSVLIKDMEMPKSCDVCPFMKTNDDLMSYDYRYMYCGFPYMGKFVTDYERTRHPGCPLAPVPPHGRLIDADALLKEGPDYEYPLIDTDGSFDCCTPCFDIDSIKNAPTIIPAEGKP